jgi:hypothetical protein
LYYGVGCFYDNQPQPQTTRVAWIQPQIDRSEIKRLRKKWICGLKGEELKKAFADCEVERDELSPEQQKFLKKALRDKIAELRAMSARMEES